MKKIIICILAGLFLVAVAAGGVFSHFGGFGTGPCSDTEQFEKYAAEVDQITIPEGTRMVALGEATHGNAEFQELKLDVFKILVEKYDVNAFALEADFGCADYVDRYIHGGPGTAEDAAEALGFAIYRTDQMAELIEYMRKYNETAPEGGNLRFYGFDMQRIEYNFNYLLESAKELKIDTAGLDSIWTGEDYREEYSTDEIAEVIQAMKVQMEQFDYAVPPKGIMYADILLQNLELGKVINDGAEGTILRDRLMAENAQWILQREESLGESCIFLTGHNGHMAQFGNYSEDDPIMGNILADELGDAYYTIGTDFFKSRCNVPKGQQGTRITHTFYSYDPLAAAAKQAGYARCWLDFSKVPADSALSNDINNYCHMGSVGEGYSILMNVLPMTYRVWQSPAERYDSMIFVSDAHPTEIK